MRTIKFRAWCDDCKVMLTELEKHQVFAMDGDGSIGFAHYDENDDWHDLIPMQYTGLKDKNGVEIWEGDLVMFKGETCEVVYHDGAFCCKGDNEFDILHIHYPAIEIIGNTHN